MNIVRNINFRITLIVLFISFIVSCTKSDEKIFRDEDGLYLLSSPQANETVLRGINFEIAWYAPTFSFVDIELYQDANLILTIGTNIEEDRSYVWMVPDNILAGSNYYIKVLNSNDRSQFAISNHSFTIEPYIKEFSELIDPLDGRVYKTTRIGNQWWMAENYRYDSPENSFWYFNDKAKYEAYGKLYTQDAASEFAPPGWHLPTDSEWEELNLYLGSSIVVGLRVDGGTGFDALLAGYYNGCVNRFGDEDVNGMFGHEDKEAHFWTVSKSRDGKSLVRILNIDPNLLFSLATICHKGAYVRYIKD